MGQKTVYRAAQIASSEPCKPRHPSLPLDCLPLCAWSPEPRRRRWTGDGGAALPNRQWLRRLQRGGRWRRRRLQGEGSCEAPPTAATSGGGGGYERWRRLRRVGGCEILKSPLQFSSSPISTTNSKWQSPCESNLASFFSAHIAFSSFSCMLWISLVKI
jgi:hypothetical protein